MPALAGALQMRPFLDLYARDDLCAASAIRLQDQRFSVRKPRDISRIGFHDIGKVRHDEGVTSLRRGLC
jgi:hypothetical protein